VNPALELVSVTAGYGDVRIVREFSARLQTGTITTLIGGNGAGKSTLLRAIYGTNRFFSGQIVFKDETIERLPPWERLRRGIGFVPQGRCNFPAMSVAENLKMGCYSLPASVHDAAIGRVTVLFPLLRQKWRIEAGNLSGGEQQMLTIARTLMGNPTGLLLDEPSEGLAPVIVERIGELLRKLRDMGVTVLLAEQNMHFCLGIASHAAVIDKGQIVYRDTIEALRNNDAVKSRYLAL